MLALNQRTPRKYLPIRYLLVENSKGRIGYDKSTNEIVVFRPDNTGKWHGYVPGNWKELRQREKNALIRSGKFKPNGKPIK